MGFRGSVLNIGTPVVVGSYKASADPADYTVPPGKILQLTDVTWNNNEANIRSISIDIWPQGVFANGYVTQLLAIPAFGTAGASNRQELAAVAVAGDKVHITVLGNGVDGEVSGILFNA